VRINPSVRSLFFILVMLSSPLGSRPRRFLVYEQPVCPGAGYLWTPGYWAYAQEGYFWVPGTWVMAPEPGLLWTPGYWGWGAQVGFYGGINYGFGYAGVGYQGGYWNNGGFFYNRSVNNVTNVTNVYTKTVIVNNVTNNVSYNGVSGGRGRTDGRQSETCRTNLGASSTCSDREHQPPAI